MVKEFVDVMLGVFHPILYVFSLPLFLSFWSANIGVWFSLQLWTSGLLMYLAARRTFSRFLMYMDIG